MDWVEGKCEENGLEEGYRFAARMPRSWRLGAEKSGGLSAREKSALENILFLTLGL